MLLGQRLLGEGTSGGGYSAVGNQKTWCFCSDPEGPASVSSPGEQGEKTAPQKEDDTWGRFNQKMN